MNEDIKRRWVAALRSGDYDQGMHRLRRARADGKMGYCCLGVLCDIAAQDGLGRWREEDDDFVTPNGESGQDSVLPLFVSDWAGVPDGNPAVEFVRKDGDENVDLNAEAADAAVYSLAELNDGGATFSRIADIIEEQL